MTGYELCSWMIDHGTVFYVFDAEDRHADKLGSLSSLWDMSQA